MDPSAPKSTPSCPEGKGQGSATQLPETQGLHSLGAAQLDSQGKEGSCPHPILTTMAHQRTLTPHRLGQALLDATDLLHP